MMRNKNGNEAGILLLMNASSENVSEKTLMICCHWSQEACPGFTKNFQLSNVTVGGRTP